MKLLFDQNISYRIIKKVGALFPDSQQTKQLNLDRSSDIMIWEFARKNGYCIVTFDSDFIDISVLKGFPPKVVWLKQGNTTTDNIAEVLRVNYSLIQEFLISSEVAFLELG